ncbi:MAG: hypothetical protein DRP63_00025 [Planctomycetota bacterium]|nr:MAG: hypothetical protein DRP63_00025 [Planctomycetota bacterium]
MRVAAVIAGLAVLLPLSAQDGRQSSPPTVELEKVTLEQPVFVNPSVMKMARAKKPADVKLPSDGKWTFYTLILGERKYLVAIEVEKSGRVSKPKRAVVDANSNHNFTDDKPLSPEGKGHYLRFTATLDGTFNINGQKKEAAVDVVFWAFAGSVGLKTVWEGDYEVGGQKLKIRWLPGQAMVLPDAPKTLNLLSGWFKAPSIVTVVGDSTIRPSVIPSGGRVLASVTREQVRGLKKVSVPKEITFFVCIESRKRIYVVVPSDGAAWLPEKPRYTAYLAVRRNSDDEFAVLGYMRGLPTKNGRLGDVEPLKLKVRYRTARNKSYYYICPTLQDASGNRVYILKNGDYIQPCPTLKVTDGDKVVFTYKYHYG